MSGRSWRGLVPVEDVLGGNVSVREMQRRNRVLLVGGAGPRGRVAKQGPGVPAEIANLALLRTIPDLTRSLPDVDDAASSDDVLVVRTEQGSVHLWEHHERLRSFPPQIGASLGRILATLHCGTGDLAGDARLAGPPAVLSIHEPLVEDLRTLSAASHDLIREVQDHGSLPQRLEALSADWRATCLVHDDVKWPNVIVPPAPHDGSPDIRLIDWEHLRRGDPAWDIGSALAAYVGFWVDAVASGERGTDPVTRAESTWVSIEMMKPAMAALWSAYVEAAGVTGAGRWALMRRAVGLCAARLVRSAFEEAEARDVMTMRIGLTLQVAANILDDPLAAAHALLGLPSSIP